MTPESIPGRWTEMPWGILDPGNGGTLQLHNRGKGHCSIKTAGAETRTIPAPVALNQELTVSMDTDGGDCTITVTDGFTGNGTIVLNDAGDTVDLRSISVGGALKWRVMANQGATVS